VSTRCERGFRPPRECTHDKEVRGPVRGGDSPAERRREPSLGPVRSARASFFGSTHSRGSSARVVPERGRTKAKARWEASRLPRQYEETMCPAVSALASHVLQKSVERLRAQRSASSVPSGSKACPICEARERGLSHKHSRARKRGRLLLVKGGRFVGARRSTSRERRATDEGVVGSSALRCGRVARSS